MFFLLRCVTLDNGGGIYDMLYIESRHAFYVRLGVTLRLILSLQEKVYTASKSGVTEVTCRSGSVKVGLIVKCVPFGIRRRYFGIASDLIRSHELDKKSVGDIIFVWSGHILLSCQVQEVFSLTAKEVNSRHSEIYIRSLSQHNVSAHCLLRSLSVKTASDA